MDKRKCERCGKKAELVAGKDVGQMFLNQFHCPFCHYTFICEGYGRFIREGYFKDYP